LSCVVVAVIVVLVSWWWCHLVGTPASPEEMAVSTPHPMRYAAAAVKVPSEKISKPPEQTAASDKP
jgi:hypothetical protein